MFFLLSKLLDVLLSPLSWAMALVALGVPWRGRPLASRFRRASPALGLLVLYVFSLDAVATALTRPLEADAPRTVRAGVTYDAVILLGGMVDEWTTAARREPSYNQNIERLLVTYDLLRTDRARAVLITGGSHEPALGRYVEARVLADQLAAWGVDPARVVVEPRARNTRENAVESARVVRARGWSRVLVVTSAAHMARAHGCFNAVGLAVDTLPVDYGVPVGLSAPVSFLPRATSLASSTAALREITGRVIYRLRGYSRPAL